MIRTNTCPSNDGVPRVRSGRGRFVTPHLSSGCSLRNLRTEIFAGCSPRAPRVRRGLPLRRECWPGGCKHLSRQTLEFRARRAAARWERLARVDGRGARDRGGDLRQIRAGRSGSGQRVRRSVRSARISTPAGSGSPATAAAATADLVSCSPEPSFDATTLPPDSGIQEVLSAVAADRNRTERAATDVLGELAEERFPLVLTERREHLDALARRGSTSCWPRRARAYCSPPAATSGEFWTTSCRATRSGASSRRPRFSNSVRRGSPSAFWTSIVRTRTCTEDHPRSEVSVSVRSERCRAKRSA
jgi:hypothetical protein